MTVPPTPPTPPPPGPVPPPVPPIPSPAPVSQSNGTATAALVCGIVGWFTCGLVGIAAIFLGISGRKKAKELGGEGSGQATAGLILGSISTAVAVLGLIFLIFVIAVGGNAAKKETDRFEKQSREITKKAEKSQSEYESSQKRNGKVAKPSHFLISDPQVEVQSYGFAKYSAFFTNKADFSSDYTVKVRCTGNLGDTQTEKIMVTSIDPGDKKRIESTFAMQDETTSVQCEVVEVLYGYNY